MWHFVARIWQSPQEDIPHVQKTWQAPRLEVLPPSLAPIPGASLASGDTSDPVYRACTSICRTIPGFGHHPTAGLRIHPPGIRDNY